MLKFKMMMKDQKKKLKIIIRIEKVKIRVIVPWTQLFLGMKITLIRNRRNKVLIN